ncbi:MAG: TonB-system energizer ExbB [Thiovulaceae bacterium]|nr:TonB-system energizer ExbB [Sulfurimonadaceae bacterium]
MDSTGWLAVAEKMLDYGVMGTLGIMSIVALWLFIERMMFYKSIKLEEYDNKELLEIDLTDNLSTLSAIGANAPYVGLIGTILGIMITFYGLGELGTVDTKKVMTGLALALKATAFGIIVAIPAIIFYTTAMRKVERLSAIWDAHKSNKSGRSEAE